MNRSIKEWVGRGFEWRGERFPPCLDLGEPRWNRWEGLLESVPDTWLVYQRNHQVGRTVYCLECEHWTMGTPLSRAQLLEWCRDNSVVWENPVRVLQFIYSIMVSFSFLSYVALACYLVCILTIGYILWFFWVLWTLPLLNSNPRRFPSATTGRDDTCWLIFAYAYLGQLSLPSDSLVSDTYFLLLIYSFLFHGVLRLRVP